MWELGHKESWVPKNWCFWTVVLEKTLESPLDCKEIQLVHPKGNQFWIFIGRNDAEAEAPKNWLIGKDPDAGKDWRQEEKGISEDEMVGWHHTPSLTRRTWVWASLGSLWWTGKPGVLQSMGLQRVRQDWANEMNWGPCSCCKCQNFSLIYGWIRFHCIYTPQSLLKNKIYEKILIFEKFSYFLSIKKTHLFEL